MFVPLVVGQLEGALNGFFYINFVGGIGIITMSGDVSGNGLAQLVPTSPLGDICTGGAVEFLISAALTDLTV
jgi:hypothetical protein